MKPVILTLFLLVSMQIWSAPKSDIIVFGFDGALIDDIQERIFREELMRDLIDGGITPVAVMDIEYLVQEQQLKIRAIPVEQMKNITLDYKTAFAVKGTISSANGEYIIKLAVYDSKNDRVFEQSVKKKSSGNFTSVYKDLAKQCAGELIKIIK